MALTDEQIGEQWNKRCDKLRGWDYGGTEVMYEGSFEIACRAIEATATAPLLEQIAQLEQQLADARKDASDADSMSTQHNTTTAPTGVVSSNQLGLLPIGTRIVFTKTLESGPDEFSPGNLYARKGDGGVITGHGTPEGYWVAFWDYSVVFAPSLTIEPGELLAEAQRRFPEVFGRLPQPVCLLLNTTDDRPSVRSI